MRLPYLRVAFLTLSTGDFRLRKLIGAAALCSTFALGGCGGGSLLGGPGANVGGCSPHTYSLSFPTTAGFVTTGAITSATACFSSATVTTNASILPVTGLSFSGPAGAVPVLYLGLTFSVAEYANGLPSLTITLPSGFSGTGHSFYVAANSLGSWSGPLLGPATPSGGVLNFPAGGGNTTFDAGTEEELVVYSN
jgi:hypothetical protein